jgi:hypothetical protein
VKYAILVEKGEESVASVRARNVDAGHVGNVFRQDNISSYYGRVFSIWADLWVSGPRFDRVRVPTHLDCPPYHAQD